MTAVAKSYDPLEALYEELVAKGGIPDEHTKKAAKPDAQCPLEQILKGIRENFSKRQGCSVADLTNSPLGKQLASDPVWNSVVYTDTPSEKPPTKQQLANFFFLVFKYMKDDQQQNSQIEANQALNMMVQSKLLDNLVGQAKTDLANLESEIAKDKSELSKPDAIIAMCFLLVGSIVLGGLGGAAGGLAGTLGRVVQMTVLAAAAGAAAMIPFVTNKLQGEPMQDMQDDTVTSQGTQSVISAATQGTQTRIQQDQQYEQNSNSNIQADVSMVQQAISQMVQAFGLGHI